MHQAGKINEAAGMYEGLLREEPANADLWALLSIAQMQLDKAEEAMASWRKCLALDVPAPVRLRTITKFLLAARRKDKNGPLAPFLDGLDIPDWPKTLPLDRPNQVMLVTLARSLVDFGRQELALRLLDGILARPVNDPDFLVAVAPIMIAAGSPEKMLEVLRPLTANEHERNGALLIVHATAAKAAKHHEEAEDVSRRAREAIPVFLSAKMPNQRLLIGVLNKAPRPIREVYSPAHLHFLQNTPAILLNKMNDEFRFLSIFPEVVTSTHALQALPRPSVIINNWVNAEILCARGNLDFIATYAESLGLPVINHPHRACLTTRRHNAERLAGIPNLVVPRVMLILNEPEKRRSIVEAVAEKLGFPVIIRNLFGQRGIETNNITTPAELASYLSKVDGQQLYAIEYIHNPRHGGGFRKMRMAVIGSERLMLNVYFGTQWNVHRADHSKPTAEDSAFAYKALRFPEDVLGAPAMAALHEIANRIPLDIFGIDFDLMPDGRILFFEANAAMSLHMREQEDPPETLLAMRKAYGRLFENPPAAPQRQGAN